MTLLEVRGVRKRFGPTRALDGVDLTLEPGSIHAVLGENGAGKSTLMKILAGVQPADEGTLTLDGQSFAPPSPQAAREAGVAIVHQEPELCPHLTVAENILLGREPTAWGWLRRGAMRERAAAALGRLFDDPTEAPDPAALVMDLPPATRQLVAIARALDQAAAKVLILDEPTSSLTAADVQRLMRAARRLADDGVAILYISHFLDEVRSLCDRFTVLRDGCSVATGAVGDTSDADWIAAMVGREVDDLYPRSADREAGEVALVLDGVAGPDGPPPSSLTLRTGEVVGIAGLVGAGRTELLRAVFGLDRAVAGTVKVGEGAPSRTASTRRRLAQGVGLLSEDRKGEGLAESMTIADNMTLSHLAPFGPAGVVLAGRQHAVAARWIDTLSIRCTGPGQVVGDLSGGNQQKVALARLLHHDVDVALLDEPTRGIDVASRAAIYALIDELALTGKAILIVSSYLPELFGVCDRIAVMGRRGLGEARPVAELDPETVLAEATHA